MGEEPLDAGRKDGGISGTETFGKGLHVTPKSSVDSTRNQKAAALLMNPAFGEDMDERVRRIKRDLTVARGLGFLGYAVGWWGLIWPQPYAIAVFLQIGLCLGACLLAVVKGKTWSLTGEAGRIGIGGMAIMPSLTLGLRAYWDTAVLHWQYPLLLSLGGSLCAVLFVAVIERPLPVRSLVWVIVFSFSATLGTLIFVNRWYDPSAGHTTPATVLDKSALSYQTDKPATSYELFLSPWLDRSDHNQVTVSRRLHASVKDGDTVCVDVHEGLLGIAWYDVETCQTE